MIFKFFLYDREFTVESSYKDVPSDAICYIFPSAPDLLGPWCAKIIKDKDFNKHYLASPFLLLDKSSILLLKDDKITDDILLRYVEEVKKTLPSRGGIRPFTNLDRNILDFRIHHPIPPLESFDFDTILKYSELISNFHKKIRNIAGFNDQKFYLCESDEKSFRKCLDIYAKKMSEIIWKANSTKMAIDNINKIADINFPYNDEVENDFREIILALFYPFELAATFNNMCKFDFIQDLLNLSNSLDISPLITGEFLFSGFLGGQVLIDDENLSPNYEVKNEILRIAIGIASHKIKSSPILGLSQFLKSCTELQIQYSNNMVFDFDSSFDLYSDIDLLSYLSKASDIEKSVYFRSALPKDHRVNEEIIKLIPSKWKNVLEASWKIGNSKISEYDFALLFSTCASAWASDMGYDILNVATISDYKLYNEYNDNQRQYIMEGANVINRCWN